MAGDKDALLPFDGSLNKHGGRASPPGWTGETPVLHHQSKSLAAVRRGLYEIKSTYTLNDDPQPQVLFTLGFSNLKPAPSSVST
jgi:hypothetical protein